MRFLLLMLATVLMAAPLHAEYYQGPKPPPHQAYGYAPHYRYERPAGAEGSNSAVDVSMTEIKVKELPDIIRTQVERMALECTSDAANADLVKAYKYTSRRTLKKKLPPDYFIDTKGLADKEQKSCFQGLVCDKNKDCLFQGFTLQDKNWIQTFTIRQREWKLASFKDELSGLNMSVFHISAPSICSSENDSSEGEACEKEFIWLGEMMRPYEREGSRQAHESD